MVFTTPGSIFGLATSKGPSRNHVNTERGGGGSGSVDVLLTKGGWGSRLVDVNNFGGGSECRRRNFLDVFVDGRGGWGVRAC